MIFPIEQTSRKKAQAYGEAMECFRLDEPDLSTQMSLIAGELFQSCGTAVIEEAEEKAPVGEKETVELLRDGEDGMKVWCINDIGLPSVDPFLLVHGLTAGTVSIAAGIVVHLGGAAVLTDSGIAAEKSRLAPSDGDCGFMGFRTDQRRATVVIIGLREDVLDRITHDAHRTSKGLRALPMPGRAR